MGNKSYLDIEIDGKTIDIADAVDDIRKLLKSSMELAVNVIKSFAKMLRTVADLKQVIKTVIICILIINVAVNVIKSLEEKQN